MKKLFIVSLFAIFSLTCAAQEMHPKAPAVPDYVDFAGDRITFEDMNHYTTVKTNMFNGIQHPSILLKRMDGSIEVLREFDYIDYKTRMS